MPHMSPQGAATLALLLVLHATSAAVLPNPSGLALTFDGADDFFIGFPTFSTASEWTLEAWVHQLPPTAYDGERCLFHQSSYSARNLLTVSVDYRSWRLRYGDEEAAADREPATAGPVADAAPDACEALLARPPRPAGQQHIAVTHEIVNASTVRLALYIDGREAVSFYTSGLSDSDPSMPVMVGACSGLTRTGVVRSKAFAGALDEVRHWSAARSEAEIQATRDLAGPTSGWPASAGAGAGALAAQYCFDAMTTGLEITDASGNSNHGARGGGSNFPGEVPRFQLSMFVDLGLGPRYLEFLTTPDNNSTDCPPANLVNLTGFLCDGTHSGYRLLSVPAASGVSLAAMGDATALADGALLTQPALCVRADDALTHGAFALQLCRNISGSDPAPEDCVDQPVHTFGFTVRQNQRPTAGEAYDLEMFGDAGFIEMGQHLPRSGTLEFWIQVPHFIGSQTLFSVSRRDLQRPEVNLSVPVVSLSLVDDKPVLQVCMSSMVEGEQAYTRGVPQLASTGPQHIAIQWRYVRTARGRAVYEFTIYRNCVVVAGPIVVEDACVTFGDADAELHFPTFGQRFELGPRGLVPSNFAAAHLADVKLWSRSLPSAELCAGLRSVPDVLPKATLLAYLPMGPGDFDADRGLLRNRASPESPPASVRCASTRLACPDPSQARGYAWRHSQFELPALAVVLTTTAGYTTSTGEATLLPALEVPLPAFDRDAFSDEGLGSEGHSEVMVEIMTLPDPSCGVLWSLDLHDLVVVGQLLEGSSLPLRFVPARPAGAVVDALACETSMTYVAVDAYGAQSPFAAEVRLTVKVPGPRIEKVELIEPGLMDSGPSVGDIIAITFDRPMVLESRRLSSAGGDTSADLRDTLEVVDGTLGFAELVPSWNEAGDVLLLTLQGQVGDTFAVISRGVCADHGFTTVASLGACRQAVGTLQLGAPSVVSISDSDSPEGCFKLDGDVFYNADPLSLGKGAETSTPGFARLPICTVPGVRLEPGVSRFRFAGTRLEHLHTAGVDSYPVSALSPPVEGSLALSFCENGTVFRPENVSCVPCGEGNWRYWDGLSCRPCPAGMFAPEPNMFACVACDVGRYMPPGADDRSTCLLAPAGSYVDLLGASRALACPRGAVAELPGSGSCSTCPPGARCEDYLSGAELAALPLGTFMPSPRAFAMPRRGHYRTLDGAIVECTLALACQGWDFVHDRNRCKEGMGGYMCQSCLSGYTRPHDKMNAPCSQCGWISPLPFVGVLVLHSVGIWILAVLSVDAACWGNIHAVVLRLALNYIAVASVLSRLEEWELESKVGASYAVWLARSLDGLFRFDGGVAAHLMGLECWFGHLLRSSGAAALNDRWPVIKAMTLFWMLMPLVWPLVLMTLSVVIFELYTYWKRLGWMIRNDPMKQIRAASLHAAAHDIFVREARLLGLVRVRAVRAKLCERIHTAVMDSLPLLIVGQFIFLPTVLRQMAVMLSCDSLGHGENTWRLHASPEVVCWRGDHLNWAIATFVAVAMWAFVLPGTMAFFVWRRCASISVDVHLRARIGFISDGYEQRWSCWEAVVHARKVVIILITAWPDLSRSAEMALYQVTGVVFLLLHYMCKPFDNRNGELLDHVELYGLCVFLLEVTVLQFALLYDPEHDVDLIAVLTAAMLMGFATVVCVGHSGFVNFYSAVSLAIFLIALLVTYCFAGGPTKRELTCFMAVAVSFALNAAYIAWVLLKVLWQILEAMAEDYARKKLAVEQEALRSTAGDAVQLAMKARNLLSEALPFGALVAKPAMPKFASRSLWQRLMNAHFDSVGALIWFDLQTEELVLGLHPDRFAHDQRISSYLRRKLAATGPFLSDDERQMIAMGLRDAFLHLLVECDMNTVHCALLEFLIRAAFAWFRLQEDGDKQHQELGRTPGTSAVGSPAPVDLSARPANIGTLGPEGDEADAMVATKFIDLLFDTVTFQRGMRASDFQAQLQEVTKLSKPQATLLVEKFLAVHRERAREL